MTTIELTDTEKQVLANCRKAADELVGDRAYFLIHAGQGGFFKGAYEAVLQGLVERGVVRMSACGSVGSVAI